MLGVHVSELRLAASHLLLLKHCPIHWSFPAAVPVLTNPSLPHTPWNIHLWMFAHEFPFSVKLSQFVTQILSESCSGYKIFKLKLACLVLVKECSTQLYNNNSSTTFLCESTLSHYCSRPFITFLMARKVHTVPESAPVYHCAESALGVPRFAHPHHRMLALLYSFFLNCSHYASHIFSCKNQVCHQWKPI